MTRQIIRRKVSSLKHGQNVRSDLGTEEELRRLGRSIRKRQRTPLLIYQDGTVIDGNRSLEACLLEGIEEVDCIVIEETLSPKEFKAIQFASAVHRSDLSPYDRACTIRAIKADCPGMTNKQLAEEELDMDAGLLTKYLSLFDTIPTVQEAAMRGEIGLSDWYAISRSPDQSATFALKQGGANRDELERRSRKGKPNSDTVKLERLPVALNTGIVIIKAKKGQEALNLSAARTLLVDALAKVDWAIKQNYSIKTATRAFDESKGNPTKTRKSRKAKETTNGQSG